MILHANENRHTKILETKIGEKIIDIWWNYDASSRLMLLLAYLMTRKKLWARAKIRVFASVDGKDGGEVDADLHQLMTDIRIDAEPVILFDDDPETIVKMSEKSSLVFLPVRIRKNQVLDVKGGSLLKMLPYLPMTAMVMAARDIDLEAEPDTGIQGETARAEDDLSAAKGKYEATKKELKKLQKKTDTLTGRLVGTPPGTPEFPKLLKAADQALEEEEDAFRKEAKAAAKLEEAEKEFSEISGREVE